MGVFWFTFNKCVLQYSMPPYISTHYCIQVFIIKLYMIVLYCFCIFSDATWFDLGLAVISNGWDCLLRRPTLMLCYYLIRSRKVPVMHSIKHVALRSSVFETEQLWSQRWNNRQHRETELNMDEKASHSRNMPLEDLMTNFQRHSPSLHINDSDFCARTSWFVNRQV